MIKYVSSCSPTPGVPFIILLSHLNYWQIILLFQVTFHQPAFAHTKVLGNLLDKRPVLRNCNIFEHLESYFLIHLSSLIVSNNCLNFSFIFFILFCEALCCEVLVCEALVCELFCALICEANCSRNSISFIAFLFMDDD